MASNSVDIYSTEMCLKNICDAYRHLRHLYRPWKLKILFGNNKETINIANNRKFTSTPTIVNLRQRQQSSLYVNANNRHFTTTPTIVTLRHRQQSSIYVNANNRHFTSSPTIVNLRQRQQSSIYVNANNRQFTSNSDWSPGWRSHETFLSPNENF